MPALARAASEAESPRVGEGVEARLPFPIGDRMPLAIEALLAEPPPPAAPFRYATSTAVRGRGGAVSDSSSECIAFFTVSCGRTPSLSRSRSSCIVARFPAPV